jgi:hypothetical protein
MVSIVNDFQLMDLVDLALPQIYDFVNLVKSKDPGCLVCYLKGIYVIDKSIFVLANTICTILLENTYYLILFGA